MTKQRTVLTVHDARQIAKFRAEMIVYDRLLREGKTQVEAMKMVFEDDGKEPK